MYQWFRRLRNDQWSGTVRRPLGLHGSFFCSLRHHHINHYYLATDNNDHFARSNDNHNNIHDSCGMCSTPAEPSRWKHRVPRTRLCSDGVVHGHNSRKTGNQCELVPSGSLRSTHRREMARRQFRPLWKFKCRPLHDWNRQGSFGHSSQWQFGLYRQLHCLLQKQNTLTQSPRYCHSNLQLQSGHMQYPFVIAVVSNRSVLCCL